MQKIETTNLKMCQTMIMSILSYPKSLIACLITAIWTILWSVISVVTLFVFRNNQQKGNFITYYWSAGILFFFNIKVHVSGRENLKSENGIFVFNHSSHFDIPILFIALRGYTARFGAKAELFKIPFFGSAMRSLGVLEIHRGQRDRVIELYRQSLKNVKTGMNYILAPEGTRQTSENLGDFKSGPFVMAIAGECPVRPILLRGAQKIMPKHSLFPSWGVWCSEVHAQILPAIKTSGLKQEDKNQLVIEVRESMQKAKQSSSY